MAALSARSVAKRFDQTLALDGITLDVAEGDCLALVGESGSGKTTLLRCFNRLVEPDSGTVVVDGRELRSVDPVALRRSMGYVPQDGGLLPHWHVGRNVELVLRLHGRDEAIHNKANEALRLVGLEPEIFRHRWPRELSGGQRQRVALARALAARPRILLLDEPFGALDAISRADLQETFLQLRALQAAVGLTCVIVTHDLHEAFLLADRIAVLRRGRLEQIASPQELLETPETAYVRELLTRARVSEQTLSVARRAP
jgi:osmoprotectant transport system ATP-binding protein